MKYSQYLQTISPLLKEVGEKLRPHHGNIQRFDQKTQSPADAVTHLDKEIERFLAERLQKYDPSIAFCGEEYGGDNNAERFWLVDPIDGTGHFIRGLPFCTTMIALIENQQVVFAAIYDFLNEDIYWAAKGEGAKRNTEAIHVSNRSLKESYLTYEIDLNVQENLDKWLTIAKQALFMKTICAGYEFLSIASGKIDGRICLKPTGKDWDYAPGSLLVSEAGGMVQNIGQETYDYRNHDFIVGNPKVFTEIKEILTI
jgi:myo-inositol-1(or 4)-monophosphatase